MVDVHAFTGHKRSKGFISEAKARRHAMLHELEHPFMGNRIGKSPNVGIKNIVDVLPRERVRESVQRPSS
jgi:hypothetical protein